MTPHPHGDGSTSSPGTAFQQASAAQVPLDIQHAREIAQEQDYVDALFARLDNEVTAAQTRVAEVVAQVDPSTPDADALLRRETEYHGLQAKLDKLNLAQLGLVFGRFDIDAPGDNPTADGLDRRYIGRMGLDDRADDYRTLLLDWRAPMARPFYLATTAQPEGVHTRRHIRTRGRTVTDIHDEILYRDAEAHGVGAAPLMDGDAQAASASAPTDESALFVALNRARTGHMSSIVETIQREQDAIIRDSTRGIMVVEGGPGTGKTAVALHRIAYLLYHHREQLARTGVLIIGPNRTFLDYISRVLPELGETGVVLSTVGGLFPGQDPQAEDTLLARELKGSEAMVDILKAAVLDYQQLPDSPRTIRVDNLELRVTPAMVKASRTRARRARKPHNEARGLFAEHLLDQLANSMAERIGADPLGGKNLLSRAHVDQLHDDLAETPAVIDLLDEFWPRLDPVEVLGTLLGDADAIASAAAEYDEETQEGLYRADGFAFTPADAALLDELAYLIGMPDPETLREEEQRQWRAQVAEAEEALDILASSDSTDNDDDMFDAEILSAHDVIDAETLARRQEVADHRTTAERARADYTWAYGHVIIDEAQELTPMEWRMVFRRCPSKWMTIVGDTAQTGSPAGVDSWEETLSPFVGTRLRRHGLSVNYRTPAPIAEFAAKILAVIDPDAAAATAVREGAPVRLLPADAGPAAALGMVAAGAASVSEAATKKLPREDWPDEWTDAEGRLVKVIDAANVEAVKGLEYDHVIVRDPAAIIAASPQGWNNLYVAVTRATQTLTIVGELPEELAGDVPE